MVLMKQGFTDFPLLWDSKVPSKKRQTPAGENVDAAKVDADPDGPSP
jgi:hypothetical protein